MKPRGRISHLDFPDGHLQGGAKDFGGSVLGLMMETFQVALWCCPEAILVPIFPFKLTNELLARRKFQTANGTCVADVPSQCIKTRCARLHWRDDFAYPKPLSFSLNRANERNRIFELI